MNRPLDKTGFELLFRNEFKGLVLFALGYVKDYDTARDLVQEAFLSMWEKRDQIDLSKPVRTYLSTIVKNKSLNYLRDNRKFDARLISIEALYTDSVYDHPDKLIESELQKRIETVIDELPEKCRQIFLLNRNEHLKYQEIADLLQISVKTVETQMSKALQSFRLKLRNYLMILLFLTTSFIRVDLFFCV